MNVDKHNIKPPMAQRKRHMVSIHEQKWNDSYYYMRDKENQDVIDYLNQENEYTSKVMKDTEKLQSDLFKEMKNRINETDQTVPTKEGNYYYYSRIKIHKPTASSNSRRFSFVGIKLFRMVLPVLVEFVLEFIH